MMPAVGNRGPTVCMQDCSQFVSWSASQLCLQGIGVQMWQTVAQVEHDARPAVL